MESLILPSLKAMGLSEVEALLFTGIFIFLITILIKVIKIEKETDHLESISKKTDEFKDHTVAITELTKFLKESQKENIEISKARQEFYTNLKYETRDNTRDIKFLVDEVRKKAS